jgi:hypothetical protein
MYSDSLYSEPNLNLHHTAVPIITPVYDGVQCLIKYSDSLDSKRTINP